MKPITLLTVSLSLIASFALPGCIVAKTTGKVAALPFKAAYGTTKFAGKSVYHTGRLAGKTVMATGKGVYYVGSVPVKITDKALDTTTKVLTVTTQVVGLGGKVMTVSRQISASQLDTELAGIRASANILSVVIDAFA